MEENQLPSSWQDAALNCDFADHDTPIDEILSNFDPYWQNFEIEPQLLASGTWAIPFLPDGNIDPQLLASGTWATPSHSLPPQAVTSRPSTVSQEHFSGAPRTLGLRSFERILPGTLAGHAENALIDTGAINLISKAFAHRHAITYDTRTTQRLTVADGRRVRTAGSVRLPWTFKDENTTHLVDFQVVADKFCNCAITFGMEFMKQTRTLTSFAHRVVRRARSTFAARTFLQGGLRTRMTGYCKGQLVTAIPDTCADVPLVSLATAVHLGLDIDTSDNYQIDLELPGKRTVRTLGMVANADWGFGEGNTEDRYIVNFYVLDGLAVDFVLDEELLWEANAFQVYEDYIIDLQDDGCGSQEWLYLTIRLAKQRDGILSRMLCKAKKGEQPTKLQVWTQQRDALLAEARSIQSSTKSAQEKQAAIQDLDKRLFLLQQQRPGKDTAHTIDSGSSSGSSITTSPP